jgi:hypothetical protein
VAYIGNTSDAYEILVETPEWKRGHVARMRWMRNAYKIFVGKLEEKVPPRKI